MCALPIALDVTDLTLGKISVEIANRLRGKKKAIFTLVAQVTGPSYLA